jgi:hypothetical protein
MFPKFATELTISIGVAFGSLLIIHWMIWWYLITKGWLGD